MSIEAGVNGPTQCSVGPLHSSYLHSPHKAFLAHSQAAMVTELAPSPSPQQSAPQQGAQAASHGLTWGEVVECVPELMQNPHSYMPWQVHHVSDPCAIRVKPGALQKLGLKSQEARSPGCGYCYLQVCALCVHYYCCSCLRPPQLNANWLRSS